MENQEQQSLDMQQSEDVRDTKPLPDKMIGQIIDSQYEVLAQLGKGGMGWVYRVRDVKTGTEYALKMISPELADQKVLAKRLEHEALAAKTLTHANIVAMYHVGKADSGSPYLIMDLVEGQGLDELLKTEVLLKPDRAMNICVQIADALVHAHYKGVVHRDLKPSNILLKQTADSQEIVKIVDFGIAKIADSDSADKTKLTQTGEMVGSPLYMSPEQCKGDDLDGRSDVYSLGCIMFELLAGKPPFTDKNPMKVLLKHISDAPPELPKEVAVTSDAKRIVARCLEKDPCDRYQTAQALLTDIERARDGKSILQRGASKKTLRRRMYALGAAIASIAMLAIGVLVMNRPQPATLAPVQAVLEKQRPETYKDKTLAQWTSMIENDPENPDLYYDRGELHSMRDERTNAIDDWTHAIALKPNFISAFTRRAIEYMMIADYKNALSDANKVISLDPDSDDGYRARAFIYNATERYPQACADFDKAIKINQTPMAFYGLATAKMKLGKYKDAEAAIREAIVNGQQYGGLPSWEGIAGVNATFTRDFPAAERWLLDSTRSTDARSVEWQELAYYYISVGKMAEAEQAMRQGKALETFPARGYRISGELYRTAGEFDKALKEFSTSTSLEEYPPGYREKAVTILSMGQWRSAYEDLLKSNKLNPYSPVTLSYLALVEDHLGMTKPAQDHIAKAFADKTVPPINYVNRAGIELNNKDLNKALADANTAIELDPWLKEAYQTRSAVYAAMNNTQAAKTDSDEAASLTSHLDL